MEQDKTLELGAEREDWRNHLKTFEREAIEGGWWWRMFTTGERR